MLIARSMMTILADVYKMRRLTVKKLIYIMMTSEHGDTFHIIGPLW